METTQEMSERQATAKLLNDAADLLEPQDLLAFGRYQDSRGRYCVLGAMRIASGAETVECSPWTNGAYYNAQTIADEALAGTWPSLPYFNDTLSQLENGKDRMVTFLRELAYAEAMELPEQGIRQVAP